MDIYLDEGKMKYASRKHKTRRHKDKMVSHGLKKYCICDMIISLHLEFGDSLIQM